MVWAGRDLKAHPFPIPCHGQGHLPPHHVAQSPIQPGLEHLQGWGIHSFSGQPGPGPHCRSEVKISAWFWAVVNTGI